MPLLPYEHQSITVDISDRINANTVIKQRASFLVLHAATQPLTNEITVTIRTRVDLYAEDNGAYGEPLVGKGLSSYEVSLLADNNSAVDPQTGAVRYIRTTENADEWAALLNADEAPLMLQGDWFEYLLNNQPVEIGPMIRRFIEQADQPPFSKFA